MPSIIPNGKIVSIVKSAFAHKRTENANPHIKFLKSATPPIILSAPKTTPAITISAAGGSNGIKSACSIQNIHIGNTEKNPPNSIIPWIITIIAAVL